MNKDQLKKLENDLWSAADKLRANSDLKSSEYSTPVLGLIFLKFADNNYQRHVKTILAEYQQLQGTRREKPISEIAIEQCGFYLPDHARYGYLLNLPEEKDIAKAIKAAMKAIEEYKPELEGVLPKDEYAALMRTDKTLPKQLLRTFADIPADASGDLFGLHIPDEDCHQFHGKVATDSTRRLPLIPVIVATLNLASEVDAG